MPGGPRIVSVTTQLATSLIDFAATPQQAVTAPRLHADGTGPLRVNSDMPAEVIEELRRRGHTVEQLNPLGGPANAIVIDADTGRIDAAATKPSTGVLMF